jgi:hypothetical protein
MRFRCGPLEVRMDATITASDGSGVDVPIDATPELDAVRSRRAELRESLNQLEQALAAAAISRSEAWGQRVHEALSQLAQDFRDHIRVTEGPDGLHQSILAGDLRLANAVQALSTEHGDITAQLTAALEATKGTVDGADVGAVRERATQLLGRIVRHRQKGADLVYEAYETDIGGDG